MTDSRNRKTYSVGALLRGLLVAAALLTLVLSCNKETSPSGEDSKERERVSVSFSVSGEEDPTKAGVLTTFTGDVSIGSLDLLAFDAASGGLACHERVEGSLNITASLPKGQSLVWTLFANMPSGVFDSVASLTALGQVEYHLDVHTRTSLPMFAQGTDTFTTTSNRSVILQIQACKVTLHRADFTAMVRNVDLIVNESEGYDTPNETAYFCLKAAYLTNVAATRKIDSNDSSVSLWLNQYDEDYYALHAQYPNAVAMLYDETCTQPQDCVFDFDYSFYCLPNPTVADSMTPAGFMLDSLFDTDGWPSQGYYDFFDGWTPRHTRLVLWIELWDNTGDQLGTRDEYFPVTLPVMQEGNEYVINELRITGPGATFPDSPIDRTSLDFKVSITPWEAASHMMDFHGQN